MHSHVQVNILFSISASDNDIIDEAIYYFKANIFFRNYEIKVSTNIYTDCIYGEMVRVLALSAGGYLLIPSWVKPKIVKLVFATSPLSSQLLE